jgi:glyoxylate/hydroxypyruvate reductase A
MNRVVIAPAPHIYFNSDLDSPSEWREALATQLEAFSFSTDAGLADPASVDIAVVWKLPEGGIARFVNLRAVLSLGAGINQLNPRDLPPSVPLARLVDPSLTHTMVEYAKAAVYRYHRQFHVFERNSRERRWTFIPPKVSSDTSVGVLGLGQIGGAIALALSREGFNVRGWSRTQKQIDGLATYTGDGGLERMVGECDILINVLPLTTETSHLLNRRLFSHCRPGMCLINMGRGLHLVEKDLIDAIAERRIDSATLDVAIQEPLPPGHPFWNHPNILVTPHVAGISIPMTAVKNIAENIRRAMCGERLMNEVDLARGY